MLARLFYNMGLKEKRGILKTGLPIHLNDARDPQEPVTKRQLDALETSILTEDNEFTGDNTFTGTNEFAAVEAESISNAAGTMFIGFIPTAAGQALSGAGAVNVTSFYTAWTTTAADAGTLADGTQVGQLKKIKLIVDGGDGTLTPVNLAGGTTITFNDANDYVLLMWTGTEWNVLENFGCTIA